MSRRALKTVPPTFADLIAGVSDPPGFVATKRRLTALLERNIRLGEEWDAIRAASYGVLTAGPLFEASRANEEARRQVAAEIVETRRDLAAVRRERRSRIAEVLAPHLAAAEANVLNAFEELLQSWRVLDDYNAAVRAAGQGDLARSHPTMRQLAMLMKKIISDATGRDAAASPDNSRSRGSGVAGAV